MKQVIYILPERCEAKFSATDALQFTARELSTIPTTRAAAVSTPKRASCFFYASYRTGSAEIGNHFDMDYLPKEPIIPPTWARLENQKWSRHYGEVKASEERFLR